MEELHGMTYEEIVRFHGHECPGLAIGYRMATAAMDELSSVRAQDEQMVAITENDACGVDALQCVTGCTFGKGNLLFRDFGKQVYTVYSRKTRAGVRVLFHGNNIPDAIRSDRKTLADWILTSPADGMLSCTSVSIEEPEPARIRTSLKCTLCGEATMETRTRNIEGKILCIPCANIQK